jgi:hypothetical protein
LTALQGAANCIALFTVVIGVASEKMLLVQVHPPENNCSVRTANLVIKRRENFSARRGMKKKARMASK